MITATWIGVSIGIILVTLNVIGWFISYNRYSKNEARHLGKLEGKVDGLYEVMKGYEKRMGGRITGLEVRMGTLEQRVDTLLRRYK